MSNYLLDTHYLLWTLVDTKKLSKKIKDIIVDPDNTIIVSSISFWEISLKYSLRKLTITGFTPEELPQACAEMGFLIEPLSPIDSSSYHQLYPAYHKDPFDKMLIWQAMSNQYTLISNDETVAKYKSLGLRIITSK
ncbi:MAG: PIN domain nuclease [Sediminibacterium sp.]|jgi:PIN domain nuclease of toxin-antitoxin system|nr:MAG: PIN domain nuclease [Sediminibacterium sp.] [Sediminibacterium sp. FEMGT703S]